MTQMKGSYYGRVRRTAFALWRGPDYVQNGGDEMTVISGHCLFRLALRKESAETPQTQIEARAVYGNLLADEAQSHAILRAVYWDSQTVIRNNRHDPPETASFKIPARFVRIPITQARQWVKSFDGLQTSVQVFPLQDDSLPICSLRIETDPVYSGFEKIWQVMPGERNELIHAWQKIWLEMGDVLQTSPTISGIEESFPCGEGKAEVYDFQAYEPLLNLP